jgi:hypothetical protein
MDKIGEVMIDSKLLDRRSLIEDCSRGSRSEVAQEK